jgi:3-dehydro-L-gulonate 2-dehydrogenase
MKLDYNTLETTLSECLVKHGFDPVRAGIVAEIFTETTFDGVFSHGINRFPRFIRDVRSGVVDPVAVPMMKGSSNALEQWDGQKGPGITNALHCTDRAVHLAKEYGIGCAGLRNTNHWMRGGTYGWRAADKGYLFMGWTNTIPNMPSWPGDTASLGNNPFILAIPRSRGHLVLDMAMSQYSYGKLEWYEKNGEQLPEFGGYDSENRLTKDPSKIIESGRILPAGMWKGSAFSLVLDLAAAIFSGGNTSRQIGALESETALSQVFIAVDMERLMDSEKIDQLIGETLQFNSRLNPGSRYPGERSMRDREKNRRSGIDIPDDIWKEVKDL